MLLSDVLKSALFVLGGAAACASGFLLGHEEPLREVTIAPDQVRGLAERLDRVETALRERSDSPRGEPAVAAPPPAAAVRTDERDSVDSLRLLAEIRDELKTLTLASNRSATAGSAGTTKNVEAIKSTIEAVGLSGDKIMRSHFYETPAQILAAYGMPDQTNGSPNTLDWTYRIEGTERWMRFRFLDGRLIDVSFFGH